VADPTPENAAALAGAVWLNSRVARHPNENDLSSIASRLYPHLDSLAIVRACVPIAESVQWVLSCRSRA